MLDPRSPDYEPVIETAENEPKEWTPQRGLINGTIACLIAAAVMTTGWTALTCKAPMALIFHVCDDPKANFFLAIIGILIGFIITWILFTCMHKTSRMISRQCTIGVIIVALLMIIARQIAIASFGVTIADLEVSGWEWMGLRRIIISNVGMWIGIAGAVYLFREGDSFVEMFYG
ncbi:MAG: hypothetical protein DHS20C16_05550 [Phycisphaerae bacterium]|nr:MAG: hypothetical protein DHS20C16_05550 [Phycisphaerae bacterium]